MTVPVRDSRDADLPGLAAIYGHWVRHGLASFELDPPDAAEMGRRRAAVLGGGYPYLVAQDDDGTVLGYAYASAYGPGRPTASPPRTASTWPPAPAAAALTEVLQT